MVNFEITFHIVHSNSSCPWFILGGPLFDCCGAVLLLCLWSESYNDIEVSKNCLWSKTAIRHKVYCFFFKSTLKQHIIFCIIMSNLMWEAPFTNVILKWGGFWWLLMFNGRLRWSSPRPLRVINTGTGRSWGCTTDVAVRVEGDLKCERHQFRSSESTVHTSVMVFIWRMIFKRGNRHLTYLNMFKVLDVYLLTWTSNLMEFLPGFSSSDKSRSPISIYPNVQ